MGSRASRPEMDQVPEHTEAAPAAMNAAQCQG